MAQGSSRRHSSRDRHSSLPSDSSKESAIDLDLVHAVGTDERASSIQLGPEVDDLAERKLKHDLTAIIDHVEMTPEPVYVPIPLPLHQIAGRRSRSLPGLVRIAEISTGWIQDIFVLAPEVKKVASHSLSTPLVRRASRLPGRPSPLRCWRRSVVRVHLSPVLVINERVLIDTVPGRLGEAVLVDIDYIPSQTGVIGQCSPGKRVIALP